jgi:hypothetical protein
MAKIVNINPVDPITFEYQEYSLEDNNLISSTNIDVAFDPSTDYLEYFILDSNQNILNSNVFGYPNYKLLDNIVVIDPEEDLKSFGYDTGNYNTLYNFLRKRLSSSATNRYYIDQISPDRTEIRLNTTSILNTDVVNSTNEFISYIQNSPGVYLDFYLDFNDNKLLIANNILLDNTNPNDPTVLIKLYEPLPAEFDIKSECWVVEKISDTIAYSIDSFETFEFTNNNVYLAGPNTNIGIKDQINNSTEYSSYNSLTSNTSTLGTGSLYYQAKSILAERGIEINIDYSDYSQFINFSSAYTRLENFYYKLSLLEQYQVSSSFGGSSGYYLSSSNDLWLSKINDIITNFDGYEYYLYFESSSTTWPKSNSVFPYKNVLSTSAAGLTWLSGQLSSASLYDEENSNYLVNTIPEYLREDSNNDKYKLFIEMIGQHFDNVWTYLKDVTNKSNADNRLDYGVSKDIVADILRDLGIKIYQNNFSTNDLYSALIGITPSGNLYNLPYTTGSLPTPSGYEYIDSYITSNATGSLVPVDDINKEIYKRIYHNLPYLLKKKGTVEGLRALITTYGIPDTILRINEFGGKDKNNNTWDNWQNVSNYAYYYDSGEYLETEFRLFTRWPKLNTTNSIPRTIQFRFKTDRIPGDYSSSPLTSSILNLDYGGNTSACINLRYNGSGSTTSPYNGGPVDPYNKYGYIDFYPDYLLDPTRSQSVYLPIFDGGWWSVMVTREEEISTGISPFYLYAANKQYNGNDGNILGFQASTSSNYTNSSWDGTSLIYWGDRFGTSTIPVYLQELRYYTLPLTKSAFDKYVMNPTSIEADNNIYGNTVNNAPNLLAFRASLGSELYTSSTSVHPKVTGSWTITQSFDGSGNDFTNYGSLVNNTEYIFYDQVSSGIKNSISNKIKQQTNVLPYSGSDANTFNSNVLSPFKSLQQSFSISESYTRDIDYVEIAFSPQNEINEDINSSIGYFNIGEYIGDPRNQSTDLTYYPDLNVLRDEYFKKYTHNYNIWDYTRLIKYLDNSLFKMLQDWVPARTDLASGIVIKQHLLERNKYPVPQLTQSQYYYTSSIGSSGSMLNDQKIYISSTDQQSFPLETFSGGTAGVMPDLPGTSSINLFVNIKQNWSGSNNTVLGIVPYIHKTQDEFYNGEFSGSAFQASQQSLVDVDCLDLLHVSSTATSYKTIYYRTTDFEIGTSPTWAISPSVAKRVGDTAIGNQINSFLNPNTSPNNGEIYIFQRNPTALSLSPLLPGYAGSGIAGDPLFRPYGVNYIKINKTDSTGLDNTIPLGLVDNIRIKFTDITAGVDHAVLSITEYPTYYLYNISPAQTTFSTNTEILNYRSSASFSGSRTISPSLGTIVANYTSISGNTLNYFNTSSGLYTLNNTPNIPIIISASVNTNVNNPGSPGDVGGIYILKLDSSGAGTIIKQEIFSIQSTTPLTTTISASYFGIEGDTIGLYTVGAIQFNLNSASLLFTQSIAPVAGVVNPLIIPEPYIVEAGYYNSDCNPLINNVLEANSNNGLYMDVDYSNNNIIALNQSGILDNTATLANINLWNYSYDSHINARYVGTKQFQSVINQYNNGDTAFGKEPLIKSLDSCIYEKLWGGGGYPENVAGGNIQLTNILLVGDNKDSITIIPPSDSTYDIIMEKNFRPNTKIQNFQYNNTTNLISPLPVLYPNIAAQDASYWVPTHYDGGLVATMISSSAIIYFTSSQDVQLSQRNSSNQQVSSSSNTSLSNVVTIINNSISEGDKWFVSFYSNLQGIADGSLNLPGIFYGPPWELIYSGSSGIYEKFYVSAPGYNIPDYFDFNAQIGTDVGMLLFKGISSPGTMMIYGPNASRFTNSGPGYILDLYPKKVITDNIQYITKTYGSNPN